MSRSLFCLVVTASLAGTACSGSEPSAPVNAAASAVVQLAPENTAVAAIATLTSGPSISGQLTPAREATIRAQIGGSLVTLAVDRGEKVEATALVAQISSRDLDAARDSARTAIKSAESALNVAQSELQRTESLVKGGALAARELEQSRNSVSLAEAQLSAARARDRSVSQQLDDTELRAPFAGIVSERPASVGDIVAPGTVILTIIDPSSMRLEANVQSDQIQQVRPGARVRFKIRGMTGQTFDGKVDRINAIADPVTRQIAIFVSLPNTGGALIAGLFAEGRVETTTRQGVVVPLSAVDETGAIPVVTRITDGKAERVTVELGPRQPETEQIEITGGVKPGDLLIVGSARGVAAGTPVKVISKS